MKVRAGGDGDRETESGDGLLLLGPAVLIGLLLIELVLRLEEISENLYI